jgi:hypothetical protein
MATIEANIPEITRRFNGKGKANKIELDLRTLIAGMRIRHSSGSYIGKCNIREIYVNDLTAGEKLGALKFIKCWIAEMYNDAMGTKLTWDQIPNSVFTEETEEEDLI